LTPSGSRFEPRRSGPLLAATLPLLLMACLWTAPGCQSNSAAENPPGQEVWEAYYLQGAKVGYGSTMIRPAQRRGTSGKEFDSNTHLAISRFGQRVEQTVAMSCFENDAGDLLEFKTSIDSGPEPTVVSGRVEGQELVMEVQTKGRTQSFRSPLQPGTGGFQAIERSLETRPMQPGEKRALRMLVPLINQVAEVEIEAKSLESTRLLGSEARLLRIESVARLPDGQTLNSTLWADSNGKSIKTRIETLDQESFRTTRDVATSESSPAQFDLGSDLIVKVDPPLANPHATRRVRYLVELASGDPLKVFPQGPTQEVRKVGEHAAEVTVRSLRPADLPDGGSKARAPTAFLAANSVLQIDDPRIQSMAKEAAGQEPDPVRVALALEAYVHRAMTQRNFCQAFSTAAEVAETREGDCTEHSVLLAALARARGIGSRVAIGLVYVESAGGFGFHMWTEMFLAGQWVPLDATLGQSGIGAAHLKLGDSDLEGASAYSSFLPVAQVAGQLKIKVLAAE
jgi:hypothetical protein